MVNLEVANTLAFKPPHRLAAPSRAVAAVQQIMTRDQLFVGLLILAGGNGLARRIFGYVLNLGLVDAVRLTFGVSVIVWAASAAALSLVLRKDGHDAITRLDLVVAAAVFVLTASPFGAPTWFALTLVAFYIFCVSPRYSARARGALIFLATTIPLYWGATVLFMFMRFFLEVDAFATSLLTGTERFGNTVKFADGSGSLQIWPGCSSFQNMSLAFTAWIAASQYLGQRWSLKYMMWCMLATTAVFAINISRLALIGLHREYFDILHGGIGETFAAWLTLAVVAIVCYLGVRRDLPARA